MNSSRKNQEVERVQQPDNAYLVNGQAPNEVLAHISSYVPEPRNQASASQACVHLHSIFQQSLSELAYKKLAQAVIDDDRVTMKKLLDNNPSLVLFVPSKGVEIESQLTWQRFYLIENVLTIAAKRKQIDVLDFLKSYCDHIKPLNNVDPITARTDALSAWTCYEMQTNEKNEEKIVIPKEYADLAQELINVFKKETFPGGKPGDITEIALVSLFDRLLPEKAQKLDDYLDPELLLLAVHQAYRDNFASFNYNGQQIDAVYIRIIGLIESIQTPETAKIICAGLGDCISNEKRMQEEISLRAREYQLKGGQPFYRSGRRSHDGVGSSYFAGIFGRATEGRPSPAVREGTPSLWEIFLQQKQEVFSIYAAAANLIAKPRL